MKILSTAAILALTTGSAMAQDTDRFADLLGDATPATADAAKQSGSAGGLNVYFDEPVFTEMVPTLSLSEDYESAPFPYFPMLPATHFGGGWSDRGTPENAYVPTGDAAWKVHEKEGAIYEYEAADLPESMRGHVVGETTLSVQEAAPVMLLVEANVSTETTYTSGYPCSLTVSIDGEQVGSDEVELYDRHGKGSQTLSVSAMRSFQPGTYSVEADASCAFDRAGARIDRLEFAGTAGADETDIAIRERADFPRPAPAVQPRSSAAAEGVIWEGPASMTADSLPAPTVGEVSGRFDLVSGFGQTVDFTQSSHGRAVAMKTHWYPREAGPYEFMIVSATNICHNTEGRVPDVTEVEGRNFVDCPSKYGQFRHPAVSLSLDGDERGIVSEPARGHDENIMSRYGFIAVTEEDLDSGLVLSMAARAQIGALNDGRSYYQLDEDELGDAAYIVDPDGETYNKRTGETDSEVAMTPTASEKGFTRIKIMMRAPGDADWRPLHHDDTVAEHG